MNLLLMFCSLFTHEEIMWMTKNDLILYRASLRNFFAMSHFAYLGLIIDLPELSAVSVHSRVELSKSSTVMTYMDLEATL